MNRFLNRQWAAAPGASRQTRTAAIMKLISPGMVGALGLLAFACASPVTVGPVFREPPRSAATVTVIIPSCRLEVVAIQDTRRAPDILGVVGRAVKAPDDRAAWLRSVVAGLSIRGFTVAFASAAPAAMHTLVVRMTLVSAWVAANSVNKNANVVWRVEAERPNTAVVAKDYRGAVSSVNWTGESKELSALVDQAFSRSLDAMTPDLHELCGG